MNLPKHSDQMICLSLTVTLQCHTLPQQCKVNGLLEAHVGRSNQRFKRDGAQRSMSSDGLKHEEDEEGVVRLRVHRKV